MKCISALFLIFGFSVFTYAEDSSTCPHENSETILQDLMYDVRVPFSALQYFNIGKPEEARRAMAKELSTVILGLSQLLPHKGCFQSESEINKAWSMLRVLAVMHEKYPVKEWEANQHIIAVLNNAKENNIEHTEQVRNRDWNRPQ